jgi:conjugative transfer region protein TrbK
MRRLALPFGCLGWVVGTTALSAALVAAIVHFEHSAPFPHSQSAVTPLKDDALARELAHCQQIGSAVKGDARCDAAWAENRQRFFNYGPAHPTPALPPSASPTSASPKSK